MARTPASRAPELLASCYRRSLEVAAESGLKTVAFPAVSTGVYGYPIEAAAQIAVETVRENLACCPTLERIIFCCFGAEVGRCYAPLLDG